MNCAKTILIVEDNDLLLDLLAKCFARFGWRSLTAANGLDGWELFRRESIDMVLTDLRMPGLNGIELARRIRHQAPGVAIALMTGAETNTSDRFLKDGTIDWLFHKPFPLTQICRFLTAKAEGMKQISGMEN